MASEHYQQPREELVIEEGNQPSRLLERHISRLEAVYQMSEAVSRATDLHQIYDLAMDTLFTTLLVDRVSILEFDEENVMRFRAWRGLSDGYRKMAEGHSPWPADAVDPQIVLTPSVADDLTLDEGLRERILAEGIGALAFIPLLHAGRLLGKFMLYYDRPHNFTEEELKLAQTIASIVASATEHRRSHAALREAYTRIEERVEARTAQLKQEIRQRRMVEAALQRESEHLRLLQELAVAVNEAASIEEAFEVALEKICGFTGWPFAHVYIKEDTAGEEGEAALVPAGIWHCVDETLEIFQEAMVGTRIRPGEGWLGEILMNRRPVWLKDIAKHNGFVRKDNFQSLSIQNSFALPVLVGEEVVAVLEFMTTEERADEELLDQLAAVAIGNQLGRAVERARAEEKIRHSRDFYLNLFEGFPTMIWHCRPDGFYDYFNQTWLDFTGRSLEEEIGDGWEAGVHPDDLPHLLKTWRQALDGQTPFVLEYRVRRHDGQYRWLAEHGRPYFDMNGRFAGFIGTCFDVTEQREMEMALRKNQAMLAEAQRVAQMGSFEWDAKTGALFWSDEMYRIYGVDRETFQPTVERTRAMSDPATLPALTLEEMSQLKPGQEHDFYYTIIRPDGERRILHGRRRPVFAADGSLLRVYGTAQDVTEAKATEAALRQREAQYRTLARNIPSASISLFDKDLRVILMDGSMTPYEVADHKEAEGRTLWELLPLEERLGTTADERLAPYYAALRGESSQFELAYNGRTYLVHTLPLYDESGEVYAGMLMSQDITERKEVERQLARTAQQLVALNNVGQLLVSSLDLDTVLRRVLDTLRPLLKAAGVFVLLYENENTLIFAAASQLGEGDLTGQRVPAAGGIAGSVLATGKPVLVQGEEAERRAYSAIAEVTNFIPRAVVVAPLQMQGRLIGVMEAVHNDPNAFPPSALTMLEAVAAWTSIAISNAHFHQQAQAGQLRLRQLAAQLVNTQEEERQRVSQRLHDGAGQTLTALKIGLDLLEPTLDERSSQQLREASALVEQTIEDIRVLAYDLRPPELDVMGLASALEDQCREFARRTQLLITYHVDEVPHELPDVISLSFYRLLQEALDNVAKHAEATQVDVRLNIRDDKIELTVQDDGRGFEGASLGIPLSSSYGLGLLGMQERFERLNGSLTILSWVGSGTILRAVVPL